MKRFWREVTLAEDEGGWRILLDGRAVKTQGGRAQLIPSRALAEAMAAEWADQGETVDFARFGYRDMADYAIDVVAQDPGETVADLVRYGETDTLCYRAEPDEPIAERQRAQWEPLVLAAEARHGLRLVRVCGIIHKPQPTATLEALRAHCETLDAFALAPLRNLTSLSASLLIGLAALEPGADLGALWDAANLEEDWQAELWGKDAEAEARRARRRADFVASARFAALARGDAPVDAG